MVPPARRRYRELHRFAATLSLHRSSYQGPPRTPSPHYDLTAFERRRAIAHGARCATAPPSSLVRDSTGSGPAGNCGEKLFRTIRDSFAP